MTQSDQGYFRRCSPGRPLGGGAVWCQLQELGDTLRLKLASSLLTWSQGGFPVPECPWATLIFFLGFSSSGKMLHFLHLSPTGHLLTSSGQSPSSAALPSKYFSAHGDQWHITDGKWNVNHLGFAVTPRNQCSHIRVIISLGGL